ncbi:MAG: hypothetical protein ACRDUA_10850 [Micromonosporaceae bacterium]
MRSTRGVRREEVAGAAAAGWDVNVRVPRRSQLVQPVPLNALWDRPLSTLRTNTSNRPDAQEVAAGLDVSTPPSPFHAVQPVPV